MISECLPEQVTLVTSIRGVLPTCALFRRVGDKQMLLPSPRDVAWQFSLRAVVNVSCREW